MAIGTHIDEALENKRSVTVTLPAHLAKQIHDVYAAKLSPKVVERELHFDADNRRKLESIFQTTIESPQDLINRIKKLCSIKIGNVERTFAHDELARMHMQATFHGRTLEVFLNEMIDEIVNRMLESV
jgi:hypothetical protein